MTVEEIRDVVAEIDGRKDDDEWAHSAEDALHVEVLTFIAKNAPPAFADLAAEAIKTKSLKFARWCA